MVTRRLAAQEWGHEVRGSGSNRTKTAFGQAEKLNRLTGDAWPASDPTPHVYGLRCLASKQTANLIGVSRATVYRSSQGEAA
jgi:hypothetical protein